MTPAPPPGGSDGSGADTGAGPGPAADPGAAATADTGAPADPGAADASAGGLRTVGRLSFDGSRGDSLSARLDLPAGRPVGTALFANCFTCTQDAIAGARITRGLVAAGIAVLRFDFTGLGSSQGDFAATNLSSNVDDLVLASAALAEAQPGDQILIGHSLGGAAALVAAARLPRVVAVVTVNAPADATHVAGLLPPDSVAALVHDDEVAVPIAGRLFPMRRQFFDDLGSHDLTAAVASLGRPLLVAHAPADGVVGIDNARRIFEAARHPKSFFALDGADHLLSGPGDGAYAAAVIAAWASRYLTAGRAGPDGQLPTRLAPQPRHFQRDPGAS